MRPIDSDLLIDDLEKRIRTQRSTMEIVRDIIPMVERQPTISGDMRKNADMADKNAIDGLKNLRSFMEFEDKLKESKFNKFTYGCLDMAIESLKKQIPQKPVNIIEAYKVYSSFDCPYCGFTIRDYLYRLRHYFYCPYCGQKLDWSDEE